MRASESIRFCITMVDYKMHFQKISALATPKKGVIFHVENWCRMKGPPQWFTIHRLGADLDYNVIVEHVFVMTSWFSTPLPG